MAWSLATNQYIDPVVGIKTNLAALSTHTCTSPELNQANFQSQKNLNATLRKLNAMKLQ